MDSYTQRLLILAVLVAVLVVVSAILLSRTTGSEISVALGLGFLLALVGTFALIGTTSSDPTSFANFWAGKWDAVWAVAAALLGGSAGYGVGVKTSRRNTALKAQLALQKAANPAAAEDAIAKLAE